MENIDLNALLASGGIQDIVLVAALLFGKSMCSAIKNWMKNDIEEKVKSSMERQQIIAALEKIIDKFDLLSKNKSEEQPKKRKISSV